MMATLAFILRNWRVLAAVVGVVALLGGAGGLLLKVRADGYADGFAKAQQQCETEKAAQRAANQKAIDEAAKKLADLESQLELKDVQLGDYLKAVDLAADAAPEAADRCLSASAVKRLAGIQ